MAGNDSSGITYTRNDTRSYTYVNGVLIPDDKIVKVPETIALGQLRTVGNLPVVQQKQKRTRLVTFNANGNRFRIQVLKWSGDSTLYLFDDKELFKLIAEELSDTARDNTAISYWIRKDLTAPYCIDWIEIPDYTKV